MKSLLARSFQRTTGASLIALLLTCLPAPAEQAAVRPGNGEIKGKTTALEGTIILPGVEVSCLDAANRIVARVLSGPDGTYRIPGLPAGSFRLRAALKGFKVLTATVVVRPGAVVERALDLDLESVSETVNVVGQGNVMQEAMANSLGTKEGIEENILRQMPLRDGSIKSALPLLAGVIQGPAGLTIRGGFPAQSTFQIGSTTAIEPSMGDTVLEVPADAVGSVDVLPNPYAVEFGRFSSGVTVVRTRPGGKQWRATVQDFDPTWRRLRGHFDVAGVEGFSPRAFIGGPIIKDRLFLAQSVDYRYASHDASSRPQGERSIEHMLSSFTRLDLGLGKGRLLTGSLGLFPRRFDAFTLNTFTPPSSAANWTQNAATAGLTFDAPLSTSTVIESAFQASRYRLGVDGTGRDTMIISPGSISGSYYHTQERTTQVFQWVGSVSTMRTGRTGQHLFKVGADVLTADYQGASSSRPVAVLRQDGTLAEMIGFGGPANQSVNSSDTALFAQDRWRPASRLMLEVGARLDRDGVLDRWNFEPRAGAMVALNRDGSAALRGGIGLFHARTPSAAGAFGQMETRTITRYGPDGVATIGQPIVYIPGADAGLRTAQSVIWNLEYERRLTPKVSMRAGLLARTGRRELIVSPDPRDAGFSVQTLLLSSAGRGDYREATVSVHYAGGPERDLDVSYVRSSSHSDLNAFQLLYGSLRDPIVRPDQYGSTPADAPNRVVVRGLVGFRRRVRLFAGVELRNGFPYSALNDQLDFVGPPNSAGRFPFYAKTDLSMEVRFSVLGWRPWIGVRLYNAFDAFLPLDVQQNLGSPSFGSFYNSVKRTIRLSLRLER